MRRIIAGALTMGFVIMAVSGCDLLGSAFRPELSELEGIWEMTEDDPESDFEFLYLDIGADGIMRSWNEQGLLEEVKLTRRDDGIFDVSVRKSPRTWVTGYNSDFRLRGGELLAQWYPDSGEGEWDRERRFQRVESIPEGSYELDFEGGSTGFVEPNQVDGSPEWEIYDDSGNSVLRPVLADENADAPIRIAPGDNFSFAFRAKRMESPSGSGSSWFTVDLTSFTNDENNLSKRIYGDRADSLTLADRYENTQFFSPVSYNQISVTWGEWHSYRVEVTDGTELEFFFDDTSQGSSTVPYGFIEQLKIEGNPDNGVWYFDDLNVTWTP